MKPELTQKDILLLKIAFSVLIVFMMVRFAIMPQIQRYQENVLQEEMLQEEMAQMRSAIEAVPLWTQSVEEHRQKLSELSEPYYGNMENRLVDELLTGLALKQGLFPVSMSITEAAPEIPQAYVYGKVSEQKEVVSDNYVLTATADMTLRGDRGRIFAFLNDIEQNYPAVQVLNLRMYESVYLNGDLQTVTQTDAGFTLAVYMCAAEE